GIGAPAIPALREVLIGNDPKARKNAAIALVRIGDLSEYSHLIPELISVLKEDDLETYKEAIAALAGIGAPAIPALREVLIGNDPKARKNAAIALVRIGDLFEYSHLIPELILVLKKDDLETYKEAIAALAGIGAPAIPALREVLIGNDPKGQESAVIVLSKINDLSVIPALITALKNVHLNIRKVAAKSLVMLLPEGPLSNVLEESLSHHVRYNSGAEMLFAPLSPQDVELVLRYLRGEISVKFSHIRGSTDESPVLGPYGDVWYHETTVYKQARIEIATTTEDPKVIIAKDPAKESSVTNSLKYKPVPVSPEPKTALPSAQKLPPKFIQDVQFWELKVPPIDHQKQGTAIVGKDDILTTSNKRSWMWNYISENEQPRKKALEKLDYCLQKIPAVIATLYENNMISADTPLVSIYLMGSYPWVEKANDLDLVVVVAGEREFTKTDFSKLSVKAKEIVPGLETSLEIVGLETLKKAARGEGNDRVSKVIRRKLIAYSGAVPIAGVDIFSKSTPPLNNFIVMIDDLMKDAKFAKWKNIMQDVTRIQAKKKWRKTEVTAMVRWLNGKGSPVVDTLKILREIQQQLSDTSAGIKASSSGVITPEDIFERRLAFVMIKPSIAAGPDKNLLSEDAITEKLKDSGFEVIASLPGQILSRKAAAEFYAEEKDELFFDALIEHMISSSTIPVILRGPQNAWHNLKDILGPADGSVPESLRAKLSIGVRQLPDVGNIVYNRIYASDSFEATLKDILFFAERTESAYFLGSGEKLLMSLSLESDRAYFSALYRQYNLQLLVDAQVRILMEADASLTKDDASAQAATLVIDELKKAGRDKDALILADSKPLIIGDNFFPSALLAKGDVEGIKYEDLGVVQYDDIAKDLRNIQAASNVTIVQNPLNGGIGQEMDRLDFLKTIWRMTGRKSEPKLGAKAMDCYFKTIVKINDQEKEAFVSVAEATILALLYEVENGHYSQGILEEFISSETRQAMDDLMDTVYLYDRLDTSNSSKRTYGEILEEKNMLGIMPEQALFPRFDVEDNNKLTDKYTAPGSHGHWGVYALSNMPDKKLPQDGSVQIRSIFNGDGISNSPNNVIAGWMARENVPVVMITTTRAPIDVKGGMLGVEYLGGKKSRKNLLELADAKTSDKENPGQAELFNNMGISKTDDRFGKDGMQLFNTNTVLLNDTVLQPFLRDLRAMLGLEEYNRVISPKMMMKSVKQKDGKEYVQLEGAMGSSMLGLAGFLSTTDDAKI
ncbi:MAG: HEAT repeat domain-containing protein, partial [Candidatus Gorgyraea atricola]|nr:HEAT repeat domain-containing protein [Candidatus Gorgyraea atricola]